MNVRRHRFPTRRPRRARGRAFLLLEVILSLVILGLAAMVLIRAFTVGRGSVRKAEIITTAIMLAESLVEEIDLQGLPRQEGGFGPSFPGYTWTVRASEERLRYDHMKGISGVEGLEPLVTYHVQVLYEATTPSAYMPLSFSYHPLRIESFSARAKYENQIYEEPRR